MTTRQSLNNMSDHDLLIRMNQQLEDWMEACKQRHGADPQTQERLRNMEADVAHIKSIGKWVSGGSLLAFASAAWAFFKSIGR